MSDENQPVKTAWNSVQVYALSVVCLIVGIGAGYLSRGTVTSRPADKPAVVQQAPNGPMGQNGMPGGAPPSADQLKQMAEKQVAPLLEQLKKQPNDTDTMLKVAAFYFAARQFDDSAKFYEQAAALKPTAEVLTMLANSYYYNGSPDKAIATLNSALQKDPKNANALYNLGMLKWQSEGDVNGAIACWEKLLKLNPNHPHRDQVKKMIAVVKQHKDKVMPASKAGTPGM